MLDGDKTTLARLRAGEQFAYVFDLGDNWQHLWAWRCRPCLASKTALKGARNTGSSSRASTRASSTGNWSTSAGRIDSHNDG